MKSMLASVIVGTIIGWAAAARAANNVEIIPDVVYGHKFGLAMTMDVLKPKHPNGAGIVFIVSGAWHSGWFPPETALQGVYAGWFDCRPLLEKGFTFFIGAPRQRRKVHSARGS